MTNCCNSCGCKIWDLGIFKCSDCMELPLTAIESGSHIIKANWRGHYYVINYVFDIGDKIIIPNIFNEDSTIYFKIIQPSGCPLEFTELDCEGEVIEFYCDFKLSIKPFHEYIEELITAQEICGSELADDGSVIKVCKTF